MKRFLLILFVLLPMLAMANLVPVQHKNGKWGYKESRFAEKFTIGPKFDNAHPFAGNYAFVCKKGLWGIIGKDGKFVVAPKYWSTSKPYDGVTIVTLGGKYGLVKDSKEFLPIEYEYIANFGNAYTLKSNGLFGLANANGKIVLETKYKDVLYLQNNTFAVYSNKLEFVNSEGKVVEQPNNVLLYTSNNGKTIDQGERIGKIVYNTCHNGQGIMVFDKPITSIGFWAFNRCWSLTSITIPNSVTSIGDSAFSDSSNLRSVSIPESVTSIGNGAFSYCDSLTSVTIGNSVTSIGSYAFNGCTSLKSITIPDSVTEIGNQAFRCCTSLTSVTIPDSVTEIGEGAFFYCTSLKSITIPDSVTSIGDGAFQDCDSLTSITIPDSVTEIGEVAFRYCSSLTSVTIGYSVTSIGDYAFYNCKSLTSVTIPDSVTVIGNSAFSGCKSLTSITIPYSVTEIGEEAFDGCENLKSITIPNSVRRIGKMAFYDCVSLKAVYLNATLPPYLGEDVFDYYGGRICCPIYIPSSSLSRYEGVGGNWWSYYQYLRGR